MKYKKGEFGYWWTRKMRILKAESMRAPYVVLKILRL